VSPSEILTYFDITIYHNGNIIVLHVVSLNVSDTTNQNPIRTIRTWYNDKSC